jgi:hypothetical protein
VYVRGSGGLRSEVDGKSFGVHTVVKPFTNGDCNGASQARQHHVSAPLVRNSRSVIRGKPPAMAKFLRPRGRHHHRSLRNQEEPDYISGGPTGFRRRQHAANPNPNPHRSTPPGHWSVWLIAWSHNGCNLHPCCT